MDLSTLAVAKKHSDNIAAGVEGFRVKGNTIYFTVKETQQELSVTVPAPADGVSITDVQVDNNNHLICKLSNRTTIDAGEIKVSGGSGPAATDDDIIELLFDTGIISPVMTNDNKFYINNDNKIFIF